MASLNLPRSESTVRVRAVDTTTKMSLESDRFLDPQVSGFDTLNLTDLCFFIENENLNKKILFDCGARVDFENYPPTLKAVIKKILKGLEIKSDVSDILKDAGVDLNTLDSIVWSHWHWDHVGASEKFPNSVELVVGPGFQANYLPGYPTDPEGRMLDANFVNRHLREIDFTKTPFRIGDFAALDFFGDGSFYLLDAPGHTVGHICGLARTTPDTFVFLGGDICHFPGQFRPSTYTPFPDTIPSDQIDDVFPSPCPCSIFTAQHPGAPKDHEHASKTPFFEIKSVEPTSYVNPEEAKKSLRALRAFDGSPNVLVLIAHDCLALEVLPLLNHDPQKDLRDWKQSGWKERLCWRWLNDLPRDGTPGRPMLVEGIWRNGKLLSDF